MTDFTPPAPKALVRQRTRAPTRKTQASILGGGVATALVTVLDWAAQTFAHVTIPVAVDGAVIVLLSAAAAYLTHERS